MRPLLTIALLAVCLPTAARAAIVATDLYTLGEIGGNYITAMPGGTQCSGGDVIGYGELRGGENPSRALLWTAANPNGIDLTPAARAESRAYDVFAGQQVGATKAIAPGSPWHATRWAGTAASAVDLHPAGYTRSEAFATNGVTQVGSATVSATSATHAMHWTGTAASAVDMHPGGAYAESAAYGIGDGEQVGMALASAGRTHAMRWASTAASAVDLNPAGFILSYANATAGGTQVGAGSLVTTLYEPIPRALMWTGTAESAIDLTPAGYTTAEALATDGTWQTGYASHNLPGNGDVHAVLWQGSAASMVDLHDLLPASLQWTRSVAQGVSNGVVYGFALDTDGYYHEIAWAIPEPAGLAGIAVAAALLGRRTSAGRRSSSPGPS